MQSKSREYEYFEDCESYEVTKQSVFYVEKRGEAILACKGRLGGGYMFCGKCGNQVDDNALFCPYCGNQIGAQQQGFEQQQGSGQQNYAQQITQGYGQQMPPQPQMKKKMSTGMIVGIICGVAALIGLAVVLIIVLTGDDKKEEKTTEATTEAETEATEMTEATTAAVTTEATTEATTEDAVNDEIIMKAKEKHLEVLTKNRSSIDKYNWQMGYNSSDSKPVAIYDIEDNGIDDLIYMSASNDYMADLHICSYIDGTEKEVYYYEGLDAQVAGGSVYYLAALKDTSDLLLYHSVSDEGCDEYFELLQADESGNYKSTVSYFISTHPNDDYTDNIVEYSKDGSKVPKTEVDSFINEKQGNIDTFLMYSASEDIANMVNTYKSVCMSYSDAVSNLGGSVPDTVSDGQLPINGEKEFIFASGAGAWSTSLTLNADGSFYGLYGDSDMGDIGEGYPGGTRYYSDFEGRFKNITKVDENTYKMELDYYTTKQTVDTEEIYDDVLYKYSEPYGIYGGSTFYFYLPDKPVSELTEGFIGWSYGTIGDISGKSKLGLCGIYNESEDEGFFEVTY